MTRVNISHGSISSRNARDGRQRLKTSGRRSRRTWGGREQDVLFREEKATEAVLEFPDKTGMGKMGGREAPGDEYGVAEDEDWLGY